MTSGNLEREVAFWVIREGEDRQWAWLWKEEKEGGWEQLDLSAGI